MEYFIDKRYMVTGKKSHIYLDNPFNLTEHILDSIYLYGIIGAKNGLNIQTVLSGSGVSTNYVALGGTLDSNTTITGAAFNLTLTGLGTYSASSVNNSITSSVRNLYTSPINELYSSTSLRLKTPAVIASSVQPLRSVLTLTNVSTGESEFKPDRYIQGFFSSSSWTAQTITILQTTHLRGTIPIVQVASGTAIKTVLTPLGAGNPLVSITMNSLGDVTLTCTAGMEFTGQVVIY